MIAFSISFNYKQEIEDQCPEDINQLIKKCYETILIINNRFDSKDCTVIEDLYIENKNVRQKDFLDKLHITPNQILKLKMSFKACTYLVN